LFRVLIKPIQSSILSPMKRTLYLLLLLIVAACQQPASKQPAIKDSTTASAKTASDSFASGIQAKEQASVNKKETTDGLGGLVTTISFEVNTSNRKDFPDGIIPSASIEKADEDISNLVNKDRVVIHDTAIQIIIDYPLNNPYTFRLSSPTGFTTAMLLKAISKHYYLVYAEEEKTATIKTLPMTKRKIENRNQTNGRYGIWGHDIGDLILDEALVYRNEKGIVTLTLEIES
jgi:hypothetical protein